MTASAINAALKDIAANSAIQEFWITDSSGQAYLTNTGIDFTFGADPAKQPQASAFWPLITGVKKVLIQATRKREIDNQIFKSLGVGVSDLSLGIALYERALELNLGTRIPQPRRVSPRMRSTEMATKRRGA